MPKENRFAGLGEAMQSESNEDSERDDESEQRNGGEQSAEGTEVESTPTDAVSTTDEETTPGAGSEIADERQGAEGRTTESGGESNEDAGESERIKPEVTSEAVDEPGEGGEPGEKDDADEKEAEAGDSEAEASGPAFEFEATTAKSIYVRKETLERLDDAEFEVESLLRREHDIRDLTGREFHDALIHVAATCVDEIADVVVETREE